MLTHRPDIHSRWDDHAFVFIPVDGHFVAYYIASGPEPQAADFHYARLDIPERTDGYLLFIRFALAIFSRIYAITIPRHPDSLRVTKPLRDFSSLPATAGDGGTPSETGDACPGVPFEAEDASAIMDDLTAAKGIINWYSGESFQSTYSLLPDLRWFRR